MWIVAMLAVGSLVGCQSPLDDDDYRAWRDVDPQTWQLSDDGATHDRGTLRVAEQASDRQAETQPGDLLSADDYVALALRRNPSILAAERRVQRVHTRIVQVTSLDDPMFDVMPIGEMAETAAGQVGLMAGASQRFPFPGKLETRGDIAKQDVAIARVELEQTRQRIVSETRRAYWSYYHACYALRSTREVRQTQQQLQEAAATLYKAGQGNQNDLLRASLELTTIDRSLITLQQQQASARSMLNQLLDQPLDRDLPVPAMVPARWIAADVVELQAIAAQHNPQIRAAHERIEQFRRTRKLANLGRWPDVTVRASYSAVEDDGLSMAANGKDQWWLGFGINVPLWTQKYDAAEREALIGLLESVAELTARRNRIAFDVNDAYQRAQAQRKLVDLFSSAVIPQARQAVQSLSNSYRAGGADFTAMLDASRKLLDVELMHHHAVAGLEQAIADLEFAVGQSIEREDAAAQEAHEGMP